ncbi:MAG TPA: glycosyltransferase family 2 protein [Terriglobales bacterium]|nr:glycosyltransferase family 2 protein [Terriglobales bacterium]
MASKPFFSIVIPVFNRADSLVGALESVFTQTFQEYEVIVVDDGSTDHIDTVVTSYAKRGLVFLKNPANSGVGPTRNKGVNAAMGRWTIFLDSDSYLLPEALSNLKETIAACDEKVGVVYGRSEQIGRSSTFTRVYHEERWDYMQSLRTPYLEEGLPVARTELLRRFPFEEGLSIKRECGTLVWYEIGRAGFDYVRTDKLIQKYELSPTGLSGRKFLMENPDEMVVCNQKIIEHFGEDLGRFNRAKLITLHQKTAFYCLMAGRRNCALHHAQMARKIDPLNMRTWAILVLCWIGPRTARRLYPLVASVAA